MNGAELYNELVESYNESVREEWYITEELKHKKELRNALEKYFELYERYIVRLEEKKLRKSSIAIIGILAVGVIIVPFDYAIILALVVLTGVSIGAGMGYYFDCRKLENLKNLSLKEKFDLIKSNLNKTFGVTTGLTDNKARKKDIADFEYYYKEFNQYAGDDTAKMTFCPHYKDNILPEEISSLEDKKEGKTNEADYMYDMLDPTYSDDEVMEVGEVREIGPRRVRVKRIV